MSARSLIKNFLMSISAILGMVAASQNTTILRYVIFFFSFWTLNSGDLAKAIRTKTPHIHFGLYHSLFEWFNPIYLKDKAANFTTNNFVTGKTLQELYELVSTLFFMLKPLKTIAMLHALAHKALLLQSRQCSVRPTSFTTFRIYWTNKKSTKTNHLPEPRHKLYTNKI